jgi:hypothetical protein
MAASMNNSIELLMKPIGENAGTLFYDLIEGNFLSRLMRMFCPRIFHETYVAKIDDVSEDIIPPQHIGVQSGNHPLGSVTTSSLQDQ